MQYYLLSVYYIQVQRKFVHADWNNLQLRTIPFQGPIVRARSDVSSMWELKFWFYSMLTREVRSWWSLLLNWIAVQNFLQWCVQKDHLGFTGSRIIDMDLDKRLVTPSSCYTPQLRERKEIQDKYAIYENVCGIDCMCSTRVPRGEWDASYSWHEVRIVFEYPSLASILSERVNWTEYG